MADSVSKKYWIADSRVMPVIAWVSIGGFAGILMTIIAYATNGYINTNGHLDSSIMGTFGDFIGGFFGTLFSLVTVFLLWLAYQSQKEELKALSDQGKEQTRIQALSALIACEAQLLAMYNSNYQDARSSGLVPYAMQQRGFMDQSIAKINLYKEELSEILEQ